MKHKELKTLYLKLLENISKDKNHEEVYSITEEYAYKTINSEDMELMGLFYCMISDFPQHFFVEVDSIVEFKKDFYTDFLFNCIVFNGENEFIPSNYFAALELAGWINLWYKNKLINKADINLIMKKIKTIYQTSKKNIKIVIINGLLEKLFTDKKLSKQFNDWSNDTIMKTPYKLGLNPRLPLPEYL